MELGLPPPGILGAALEAHRSAGTFENLAAQIDDAELQRLISGK